MSPEQIALLEHRIAYLEAKVRELEATKMRDPHVPAWPQWNVPTPVMLGQPWVVTCKEKT